MLLSFYLGYARLFVRSRRVVPLSRYTEKESPVAIRRYYLPIAPYRPTFTIAFNSSFKIWGDKLL